MLFLNICAFYLSLKKLTLVNRIKTFKPIDMLMSAMIHYEKISHVKHDDGKKTLLCLTESRWDGVNRWRANDLERS